MELLAETYIVLDVPEAFASRVLRLRLQSGDSFRAALPVEITLIGSGGAGPITRNQDLRHLTKLVRAVAQSTAPIKTSFGRPMRFPGSEVFVLPLIPAEPIVELHNKLRAASFVCRPSAWPFVPHCTIRSRSPVQQAEADALLSERLDGTFTLAAVSIYTTNRLPDLALVERVALKERAPPSE